MKKIITSILLITTVNLFSQTDSIQKYQRSSLTMILLTGTNYQEDTSKIDKDEVKIDNSPQAIRGLWNSYPFPDMYDKHSIFAETINVKSNLSTKSIFEAKRSKNQKKDAEATQSKIAQELKNKKIAHQVVRRWFSSEDGSKFWDMGTIQKRGFYNATELEADIAKQDIRGMAKLADAGESLINNSFVTVTEILLYANKPVAILYNKLAEEFIKQANQLQSKGGDDATQLANSIAALTYSGVASGLAITAAAIKDGYTVVSKTYLYKLKWNNDIAGEFYKNWGNNDAFEKMNFELDYIGYQLNETILNRGVFSAKANRKPDVVVKQAVIRNIDETFVLLQQENEVFKPSIPVLEVKPISAQIGMKEGLQGGEKFNVLQKIQNLETGKTSYKKVGFVTVDKNYVWDNRYNAGEGPEHINYDVNGKPIIVTQFKGGKNVVPGMLLKQAEAKKKKKKK